MTNKQYEHLGRALVYEAKLEVMRQEMDDQLNEMSLHLGALAGNDAANVWLRNQYGKQFAVWHGCRDFMDAVRDIIAKDEKKEAAK